MASQAVSVDDILKIIGECGKYQIGVLLLAYISFFPNTFQTLIMYFGALNPSWQCTANSTVCKLNGTQSNKNYFRCHIPRTEWEFTKPKTYSVVTEFDLFCDSSWLIQFSTSIYFFGWLIGSFFVGWLSDKYGRKKTFFACTIVQILVGFISSFSPNIYVLLVLRFISGFTKPGGMVTIIILTSELLQSKYRPLATVGCWVISAIAVCFMGLIAYYVREWKTIFILCSIPYIFIIFFYKQIPESIRWQRLNGKIHEATESLKRIAKVNSRQYPEHLCITEEKFTSNVESSFFNFFRSTRLAICTLIQGYIWMVCGMVYYALFLAADDLGGNIYRDFVLLSLVEAPSSIILLFLLRKIGRKTLCLVGFLFASLFLLAIAILIVDDSTKDIRVVLGMFGVFFISVSFNTAYTWSVEIIPTSLRGQGTGFLQVTARIGSMASPWVAKSLSQTHASTPYALMCVLGFIASVLCCFLPETMNKPTLETVNDFLQRRSLKNTMSALMEPIKTDDVENESE